MQSIRDAMLQQMHNCHVRWEANSQPALTQSKSLPEDEETVSSTSLDYIRIEGRTNLDTIAERGTLVGLNKDELRHKVKLHERKII